MENCYLLDKYGAIKLDKLEEIDIRYLALECVIKGQLRTEYMYYPYITASNPVKYMRKVEIAMAADKDHIKYIKLSHIPNTNANEYPIVFYKDDQYKNDAILYAYLMIKYRKQILEPFNPIEYILHTLAGYGEEYNRRFYTTRYVNNAPIEVNKNLSMKERYMAKYRKIKEQDNFADFKQKYDAIRKEAGKILEKTKKSKEFMDYVANIEIHPFKFSLKESIGNNPLYQNHIKK